MLKLFFTEKRQCSHYHVHVLIHFPLGFEIKAMNAKIVFEKHVKWSCQNKRGHIKRGLLSGPTRVLFNLVLAVIFISKSGALENRKPLHEKTGSRSMTKLEAVP